MKALAAFLLGMVAANHSLAGSDQSPMWLVMSGFAQHLGSGSYCNNHFTKGIGVEKDGYALGIYDNSNCRLSLYGAKSWLPLRFADWRLGAIAGGATGYGALVIPVGGLAATYERKTWGANAIFIPPLSESSPGVLWLQWKKPW
jgi:hypothetical protein